MGLRAAVAGASGYAGGELLRILAGHPEFEIGALTAGSSAGTLLGAHQPHLPPLADRVLVGDHAGDASPVTTSSSWRCRTGSRAPLADAARRRRARRRLRRRLPARRPGRLGALLRPAARGHLAVRPARAARASASGCAAAGASRCPAATRPRSPLALSPAYAAGLAEPDAVVVAASGTSGAGRAAKAHLLGSEVMGS